MSNNTKIRLLLCGTCGSMEELPDYEGRAEDDHLLAVLVAKHKYPDGNEHTGGLLIRDIREKHWRDNTIRSQIIEQINARTGEGLGAKFYESKNTFVEDALKCWTAHNRTENCDDYKSKRKELIPDTKDLRKEAGLGKTTAKNWLCQFCPYHRIVANRFYAASDVT